MEVEITREDIDNAKTDSDRICLLIKIALSNCRQLKKQNEIFFGDGDKKKGICSRLAIQETILRFSIYVGGTLISFIAGLLIHHVLGV